MQQYALSSSKSTTLFSELVVVLSASLLIGLCANISIPFFPVNLTLQTGALFVIAGLLGPARASWAIAAYIGEGMIGLPVFQGGASSFAHLMGPTGGYLMGFLPLVTTMGFFTKHAPQKYLFPALIAGGLVSSVVMYAIGLTWLSAYLGWTSAVQVGLTPFILGDLLKIFVASGALYFMLKK